MTRKRLELNLDMYFGRVSRVLVTFKNEEADRRRGRSRYLSSDADHNKRTS